MAEGYRDYNYAVFTGEEDFDSFMGQPHVGARAPEITLLDLESGAPVALADLWRERHLMIEFGSYT